jgi:hypothetical protein
MGKSCTATAQGVKSKFIDVDEHERIIAKIRNTNKYVLTHPPLAFNVVELALGTLADALGAPQFDTDPGIGEGHQTDG